jgi:hypothetical protein
MTEPKKPINFFKILPSFQSPGMAMSLRHGDSEEQIATENSGFALWTAAPSFARFLDTFLRAKSSMKRRDSSAPYSRLGSGCRRSRRRDHHRRYFKGEPNGALNTGDRPIGLRSPRFVEQARSEQRQMPFGGSFLPRGPLWIDSLDVEAPPSSIEPFHAGQDRLNPASCRKFIRTG